MSSLFMSVFFIVPAFSASVSFCAIQVSDVGVWDSFWNSRVIVWVVGLFLAFAFFVLYSICTIQ